MKTLTRAGVATGLLLATLGARCDTTPSAARNLGFVQTVQIEPAEPHQGDKITIRTVVTNPGPNPKHGTFMACALGFGGELALSEVPETARCAAVSFERELATGESVEGVDTKVVDSPAGTYSLEVRYLIDPAMSQTVTVRVLGK